MTLRSSILEADASRGKLLAECQPARNLCFVEQLIVNLCCKHRSVAVRESEGGSADGATAAKGGGGQVESLRGSTGGQVPLLSSAASVLL